MATQLIKAFPSEKRTVENKNFLRVSEFYCDTIQGEGTTMGCPATFLRLQGCTLNCRYCDTTEVWGTGNPYTFDELFVLMREADLFRKFKEGQHLVITGGSPLLQKEQVTLFIKELNRITSEQHFKPYIEIENECVILPDSNLVDCVSQWNNSPKLSNSGVYEKARYKPTVIKTMALFNNSWFKFVISSIEDWEEIKEMFLIPELIKREQVILMPEGDSREKLDSNKKFVVELAIKNSVRYSPREHISLWGKKVGV